MVLCFTYCLRITIRNGRSIWEYDICRNLEINLYMEARALEHVFGLDLCNLFKSYDVNNTEYSYCLEKFLTTNERFK